MFDYRVWLAPYLAIVLLVCCCLVTTCFAQMYANKDNKKGGEIQLKDSERKKIRKKKRKTSPYGATDSASTAHSSSQAQTSGQYFQETNLTEKSAERSDQQCDEENDTCNENNNHEKGADKEKATQDDATHDKDNESSLNTKVKYKDSEEVSNIIDKENKYRVLEANGHDGITHITEEEINELENENIENSDVIEVIDSKENDRVIQSIDIDRENTKNKGQLEKENIKNSEVNMEAISSEITVSSSINEANYVD